MNREIKLAYLMILGKGDFAISSEEYHSIFKFISKMDVNKQIPWFIKFPFTERKKYFY